MALSRSISLFVEERQKVGAWCFRDDSDCAWFDADGAIGLVVDGRHVPYAFLPGSGKVTLAVGAAVAWGDDAEPAILTVDDVFAGALDAEMLRAFLARLGAEVDAGRVAQVLVATAHPSKAPAGWLLVETDAAGSLQEAVQRAEVVEPRRRRRRAASDPYPGQT